MENKSNNKNIVITILSIIAIILVFVLIFVIVNKNSIIENQNNKIEKLNTEIRELNRSLKEKNEAVAVKKISGNYNGEYKYQNYTSKYELLLREDGTAEYCMSTTNIKCDRGTYVIDGNNITFTSKETVKNVDNSQAESNELIKFTYDNDNITTQDISNNIITLIKTENKLTMTEKYFK